MELLQKAPWPDWKIVRLIGQGSFGAVYEIQRVLVDGDAEAAALKVISIPQNSGDIEELYCEGYDDESITATFHAHLKSIVAEYSLMRKMDGSANVVNCKDICYIQHTDGIGWDICIRMELLTPLMKALPVSASEDAVIKIGKDICNALVLCKKHEIVHRDIKPQNIFVSPNGDYKLGDFGIAKTVEKTMDGTKIGTYKYMAPEVYNNQPYGSGADIYSLGLVLYWLLNDRRMPFMPLPPKKTVAGMEEAARHRRLSGEPLPPPAHGSPELKQIVLKACTYNPKDRYASAAAMLEDLNQLARGAEVVPYVVIPDAKPEEKQEDNKTTGPVSYAGKKVMADRSVGEHPNVTDCLKFAPKIPSQQEPFEAQTEDLPQSATDEYKKNSKKNVLKYFLIALGVIAGIVLFFLLRSCSGKPTTACNHKWVDVDENEFTLVSVRCIEIPIEVQQDDVKVEAARTAKSIMSEFVNGDTSEKNFALLAHKYSKGITAQDGGLYQNVYYGQFDSIFNAWCFDEMRDYGDCDIIETNTAYVLTYFLSKGEYYIASEKPQYCSSCYETNGEVVPFSSNKDTAINQTDWSDWVDELPANISEDEYEIETRTLYSSRELETSSSTETSSMPGWELYDTVKAGSDYGPWSNWSSSKVSGTDTRQVQTETRYRYRDKETTTGSSSSKSGWTLYDTTYSWGNYGAWSSWSTTAFLNSDSRKVETKTQYRYRSISYSTEYTSWSGWGEWSIDSVTENDLTDVETSTVWGYYYFSCPYCGTHLGNSTACYTDMGGCGKTLGASVAKWHQIRSPISWDSVQWYPNAGYCTYIDGVKVFKWPEGGVQTGYRYRTRSTQQIANYGSWSSWGDTAYTNSSSREVQTRTVYRYCDRSQIPTYHFYRWGNWSSWSTSKVTESSDRQVELDTFYRYRDKATTTTYYFRRWTNWTAYSKNTVQSSENVDVRTKTQYRYKEK